MKRITVPKTLDECLDFCDEPDAMVHYGSFIRCLDRCDERFAAGKEPKGDPLDFTPVDPE